MNISKKLHELNIDITKLEVKSKRVCKFDSRSDPDQAAA